MARLRRAGTKGEVEEELERIRDAGSIDPGHFVELNAIRFYIRDVIRRVQGKWRGRHAGVTNYVTLMGELREWQRRTGEPVRLVTFNYDTMLEEACAAALTGFGTDLRRQLGKDDFSVYIRSPDFRIYKPHGSVDWVQLLATPAPSDSDNDFDAVIALGDNIDLVQDPFRYGYENKATALEDRSDSASARLAIPAIALPLTEKTQFVFPDNHLQSLSADLAEVSKVITIGWRGSENHFLQLWAEAMSAASIDPPDALAVGGHAVAAANLASIGIEAAPAEQQTFSGFVAGGQLHQLLP
jgi:hypothetical protein